MSGCANSISPSRQKQIIPSLGLFNHHPCLIFPDHPLATSRLFVLHSFECSVAHYSDHYWQGAQAAAALNGHFYPAHVWALRGTSISRPLARHGRWIPLAAVHYTPSPSSGASHHLLGPKGYYNRDCVVAKECDKASKIHPKITFGDPELIHLRWNSTAFWC